MTPAEEAGPPPRIASGPAGPCTGKTRPPGASEQRPAAAQGAAWRPGLRDDEVDAVERDIIDDDLGVPRDPRERARVENVRHRLADRMFLDELAAAGFTGAAFDIAATEFSAYGTAVMMAWMRTGAIIRHCKARGRPLALGSLAAAGRWSRDDRLEIALETTARAWSFFVDEVLMQGKWDHRRGATLKTFFVGACLLQFPNTFDVWASEQKRWSQVTAAEPGAEDLADTVRPDACWSDPTCEAVIGHQMTQRALNDIKDPGTRHAALMVMRGHSLAEAGEAVGLSAGAVEGRLYRLRRRSR
jgi:hypothetical protein